MSFLRRARLPFAIYVFCAVVYVAFLGARATRPGPGNPAVDNHFVHLAQSYLDGQLGVVGNRPPGSNDWACYDTVEHGPCPANRHQFPAHESERYRWYVSFPPLPAVVILPVVAVMGSATPDALIWALLGGLGPALVFLAWNQVSFGDPLTYGYAHKLTPSMAAAHEQGILGLSWPRTEGLSGLLLSGRRGLFFLAPWLILAPVGVVWACLDRRVTRAWRVLLVLGTVVVPVLLSGFADWHGGQTLGPRYLVFVMPLFGVAAALAVDRLERGPLGPRALPVVAGLLISSLALLLLANAGIPAVTAEIANPLTEVVFPVLFKAGPLGTVWDPLVGAVLGTALAIGAAIALVLLVAAWSGKTPATGVKSRARGATALVIVAALVHLAAVQLPWTREPPRQETVLRARWFCYAYMGEDALRRQLEVEIVRKERR